MKESTNYKIESGDCFTENVGICEDCLNDLAEETKGGLNAIKIINEIEEDHFTCDYCMCEFNK